jgi:hypothetical protein
VAGAESRMRLVFAQLEEIQCVAKLVAGETLTAQHRVFIGDGQRGVVSPDRPTLLSAHVLNLVQRLQEALRLAFQYLNPPAGRRRQAETRINIAVARLSRGMRCCRMRRPSGVILRSSMSQTGSGAHGRPSLSKGCSVRASFTTIDHPLPRLGQRGGCLGSSASIRS